ncbi:MAG TPA: response regulator transcription factor [Bryobacteraceae bacterium]|jgi:DNA-binding NarL/FixJ family response regulator|nr:response regulator transcription factor [Bryobacteraceae bacterium]
MTRPILLVDDHAAIRRGISDILTAEIDGLEFGFAGSEAEAMKALGNKAWDLVTVDLNLPGRGGLDLIRDIKALDRPPKILVYTMHSEDQLGIRALRAGADGYLTKDAHPDEIVVAVRALLQGRRYIGAVLADQLATAVVEPESGSPHEGLSEREYQVLVRLASGHSLTQIGEELSLSVKTVSTYRSRVLEKLHLTRNSELVRYALKHKLIE